MLVARQGPWQFSLPLHVFKYIAFAIPGGELESQGSMMALQHRRVVVENCELAASIAQEGICSSWVIHVIDCGSNERGNLINRIQSLLKIEGCLVFLADSLETLFCP